MFYNFRSALLVLHILHPNKEPKNGFNFRDAPIPIPVFGLGTDRN
jgi:hypothetical protein